MSHKDEKNSQGSLKESGKTVVAVGGFNVHAAHLRYDPKIGIIGMGNVIEPTPLAKMTQTFPISVSSSKPPIKETR